MRSLALLAVVALLGAGPLPALSPEQERLARERVAAGQQALQKWQGGERAAAIASMEKALALAQRVWGEHSHAARIEASLLALWELELGRWDRAAGHHERIAQIQAALLGEGHWEAIDARWQARTARLLAGWTA